MPDENTEGHHLFSYYNDRCEVCLLESDWAIDNLMTFFSHSFLLPHPTKYKGGELKIYKTAKY